MQIFKTTHIQSESDLKTAVLLSIVAHFVFILFFIFKSATNTKAPLDLSQAISVSISNVALPLNQLPAKVSPAEQIIEKPAQPEPAPEPVAVIKPIPPEAVPKKAIPQVVKVPSNDINLKAAKQKQKSAFDKIKKLSALEKIKQDVNSETMKSIEKSIPKRVSRVIAAGQTLGGLDRIEADEYLQKLDAQIKQAWSLPQWLAGQKKLRTQVLVKFNKTGQLLSTQVTSSSGQANYDSYCLQAVNKAAPFPPVPEKFLEKFSIDGLVIGFPE